MTPPEPALSKPAMQQDSEYKRGSRVVLIDGIPSVPEGTSGKIGRALGIDLKRYRVSFDNQTEVLSVAHGMLVPEKEWPKFLANRQAKHEQQALAKAQTAEARAQAQAVQQTQPAPQAAPEAGTAPAATSADSPADSSPEADDSSDPRLAKLLERSQAARKDSGVPSPTPTTEKAPAPEPEQAQSAASSDEPEPSTPVPAVHEDPPAAGIEVIVPEKFVPGPEIDVKNYPTNDRVYELLAKVRGDKP